MTYRVTSINNILIAYLCITCDHIDSLALFILRHSHGPLLKSDTAIHGAEAGALHKLLIIVIY